MMPERPVAPSPLLPPVASYASSIAGAVGDGSDAPHAGAADRLADWIAGNFRPGEPLSIVVVCTGNSRRSILGATLGNVASAHFGMPEVRFSSGGTDPSAFNPRTVNALRAVGIEVSPTGDLASPGPDGEPNPIYRIRWGAGGGASAEAIEFSKRYDDPSNPRSGFAALMVCDEADASCPSVPGASLRLSIPFADPKEADGTPEEASRYAERRDDLARLMARALSRAKERLNR